MFERPEPEIGTENDVLGRRIAAILIDLILLGIITSALGGLLFRGGLAILGSFVGLVISFAYYIYFEGTYGQTLGKMALGLVVVTEDGEPIDFGPAAIRTVLRIVDVLPVLYLVGLIVIVVTDRNQRLGDIVADTVVVRARKDGTGI